MVSAAASLATAALIYLSSDDISPSRSRSRMVIKAKKSKPKSTSLAIMGADHLPEEDDYEDDEYIGDICMLGLLFCAEVRYVSDELVAKPNETSSRITN